MDPQVSTSFIPKEALTAQKRRTGGMGLVGLIGLFIFVLSVVAAGAVFGYQKLLMKQITDRQEELKIQKDAIDAPTVQILERLNSRIEQAKTLLNKHVAPTAIFDFLAQKTLTDVQFTSFDYSLNSDGSAAIELDGIADSFTTVALQSDALGNADIKVLKDVIFSGITIDPATGRVAFVVHGTVLPPLLSYSNYLAANPADSADQTAPPASEATTSAQ